MEENKFNEIPNEPIIVGENPMNKQVSPQTKKNHLFVWIIVILIAIASVVGVYFLTDMIINKKENKDNPNVLFTKDTLPRIDASLATQPLVDAFVKDFTGNTTKELGIEYTNTHPGYVKLINNETDLIVVTEPSDEELALAKE